MCADEAARTADDSRAGEVTDEDILTEIRSYERAYGLSSADFYQKWLHFDFEDSAAADHWAALYRTARQRPASADEQADRECGRCRYARPYNPLTVVSDAHNGWAAVYRDLWIECRRDGPGNERHWRAGAWDGVALLCDDYEASERVV